MNALDLLLIALGGLLLAMAQSAGLISAAAIAIALILGLAVLWAAVPATKNEKE